MHHALSDPEAAERWVNTWVSRGAGKELKDVHFPKGYNLITIGLNDHDYKTLWEPLFAFERPEVGLRYKGRFEESGQNVPSKRLIADMLEEQPAALFLDELQGWYEGMTNAEDDSGPRYRAWAFSFLQMLSEIATEFPVRLLFIASVVDTETEAFQQIRRNHPRVINFQSAQAPQDLYWLLGTSVRNIANFAFSSYLCLARETQESEKQGCSSRSS